MDEVEIPETKTRIVLRPAVALVVGILVGVGVGLAVAAALTAVAKEYGEANVAIEEDEPVVASIVVVEE